MRNLLLFIALLTASLLCSQVFPQASPSRGGYGFQTPPPPTQRFVATSHGYLESVAETAGMLAELELLPPAPPAQ